MEVIRNVNVIMVCIYVLYRFIVCDGDSVAGLKDRL